MAQLNGKNAEHQVQKNLVDVGEMHDIYEITFITVLFRKVSRGANARIQSTPL